MRNVYLIPSEAPTRLYEFGGELILNEEETSAFRSKHVYITSNEKIEFGDWYLVKHNVEGVILSDKMILCRATIGFINHYYMEDIEGVWLKVVLTTNKELQGVQLIQDEFLEWLVKHPTCENVKIQKGMYMAFDGIVPFELALDDTLNTHPHYKIILPHDLNYWMKNAEEDYKETPISVLKYISELETEIHKRYSQDEALNLVEDYDREFKLDTFAYTKASTFTVKEWFKNKKK